MLGRNRLRARPLRDGESAVRSLLLLGGVLLALWVPPFLRQPLFWLLVAAVPLLLYRANLRIGLLLVGGFLYAQQVAHAVQAPAVVSTDRQLIQAQISSIPSQDGSGWRFDAQVSFPRQPQLRPQRVRLTMPAAAATPRLGETWQFAAQFSAPPSAMQARALLRDQVSSMARVVPGPLNHREAGATWSIDQLRARVAARIDARVADPSAAALLAALAVGATGEVSAQQWRVFNATGITHLVAISGMHVTFFALLSMVLARVLWRRIPLLAGLRREVFAAATGVVLALAYALLSGFSVPAQRTVVMLAAFLLLRECARASRPAWSVAAALTVVLLYDPLAALSAGFWLSFAAVAAIVLLAGARMQQAAPLRAATHVQGVVTLALLPATLAIFGSFSAVGVLANALAIPVFTFLLVPPVLLATLGYLLPGAAAQWCADQLVSLASVVASWLWPVLARCAEVAGAVWTAQVPTAWYLLALPALLLALTPVTRGLRCVALAALCSVFLLREPRPARGELWLDMLDVGASSAVLLRTEQHLLLYGTGEKFGSAGRSFDSQVLPQLRRSGYPALDLWLAGSLGRNVQAALVRAAALLPLRRVEIAAGPAPPELAVCTPRNWRWDGIEFSLASRASVKGCVLQAAIGGHWVELASESGRVDGAKPPLREVDARLLLLPRAASAAAQRKPALDTLLLASVSQSEWQSASWLQLRRKWASDGFVVLATAAEGSVRLRISADGRVHRPMTAGRLQEVVATVFGYHARP
ncbi:MAG: ComEC/Rec2 family competence protein [Steroidobacteraceae bacterium]